MKKYIDLQDSQKKLMDEHMPKPKKKEKKGGVSSWFSWGRSAKVEDEAENKLTTMAENNNQSTIWNGKERNGENNKPTET